MQHSIFLEKVRQAYVNARDCVYMPATNSDKLERVSSHSISSVVEDLFGCYCAEKISTADRLKIHIDPQLSFKGSPLRNKTDRKPLLIRPDLMIERNNVATCFFDIKTDIGYKRTTFLKLSEERNKQMDLIKGKMATFRHGKTKIDQIVNISENIKFIYVFMSDHNMTIENKNNILEGIQKLPNLELYLLINGHPNTYGHTDLGINVSDFNRLDQMLDEYLG